MNKVFQRLSKTLSKSLHISQEELEQSFHLASLSDVSDVSTIRRNIYGSEIKSSDEAYLTWRYFHRGGYTSTLWVFRYRGQIIGAVGSEPVELIIDYEVITAIRNMDAIVHPDFNNSGIGAWMNLALQHKYDCILVSGGNKNSVNMLRKLFYSLAIRNEYKLLFSSKNFLRTKFNRSVSFYLSPIVDSILQFYIHLKLPQSTPPDGCELYPFGSIEELLSSMPDKPGRLGTQKVYRSKEYLHWRYVLHPGMEFKAVGLISEGSLVAYVIFYHLEVKAKNVYKQGRIVDWDVYGSSPTTPALISVFKAATTSLQSQGVDEMYVILNDSESRKAISTLGYSHRNTDDRFFIFCKDDRLRNSLLRKEGWYLSQSDSDRFD